MAGSAADTQAWRKRNPDAVAKHREQHRIRQRAYALLAQVHPTDFKALQDAVEADMEGKQS